MNDLEKAAIIASKMYNSIGVSIKELGGITNPQMLSGVAIALAHLFGQFVNDKSMSQDSVETNLNVLCKDVLRRLPELVKTKTE